ncbi:MAG: hypothetical protein IPN29_21435 [Saprospiraceae bacterium]|nr:hypothetical protein [Saprospiraceae bacterium]
MALFGFGSRPKPQGFDYTPLYYDPAKEELKARLAKSPGGGIEFAKERIKLGFRAKSSGSSKAYGYKAETRKSNQRLFVIIIVLFILAYFMLKSQTLVHFLEKMNGQ